MDTQVKSRPGRILSRAQSMQERADEVLVSVAVLGLIAAVADGNPDVREVARFTRAFEHSFALSRRKATRLIGMALRQLSIGNEQDSMDAAIDSLNEYLTVDQKMRVFDGLAEVLVADGAVHEGEVLFLDYVAMRLDLHGVLQNHIALMEQRRQ